MPPDALPDSPLRRIELLLALLALLCALVWTMPVFQSMRGVPLMPVWLHTVMEVFAVTVSFLLFGIVWNGYSSERSGSLVILGCAALGVGLLDIAHLLSYKTMPDFVTPPGVAKAINFWLAARAFAAFALLAIALRTTRPLQDDRTRYLLLAGTLAISGAVIYLGLYHPDLWPHTFEEGVGLTDFKVAAEWAIIAVLAAGGLILHARARRDGGHQTAPYIGFAGISILSEFSFTAYTSFNDLYNLLGHLLKIAAYLFLYRAAFVASVRAPFRQLRVEIAERVRAEAALRELNQSLEQRVAARTMELEQANRELEAFSYSVSHDLRAPLRAIEGFSQVLARQYEPQLDARGKDYLGRVQRASERMGGLIDAMLHLSRLSRQPVARARVDISRMAADIADELRDSDPSRRVDFVIAPGLAVDADAGLIRIVLENLMGNAWKFSARKDAARIEVGQTLRDGVPAIYVRDNGAGFSMEYAAKLFGAFQRLHSSSEFEGTGIGLATVQRIVARHGGQTWAEGVEGQGATFYFSCGAEMNE